jgi:dissimilatory sulfite reductase (desulfoviridin) alpha/beta subunit
MAGRIRQPVDEAALEKFISENVPDIKTPIDLKQVSSCSFLCTALHPDIKIVWFWSIQSNISNHRFRWPAIRDAQEATWEAPLQDRSQSRARVPHHACP